MALNIKNERVHELAREAARRTDASQTSAIEAALERYVSSLGVDEQAQRREEKLCRAKDVLRLIHARITDEERGAIRRDLEGLYDDEGMPA